MDKKTRLAIVYLLLLFAGLGSARDENPDSSEVSLLCPLTADVNSTKQGVLVVHFAGPNDVNPEDVMGCSWLQQDPDNPYCDSQGNFKLLELHKDRVVVRGPKAGLHNDGSYQCQLIPPDKALPFTMCLVLDGKDVAGKANPDASPPELVAESTSIAAVTKRPETLEQNEPTCAECESRSGLVVAVVFLTITICILLLVVIVLTVLLLYRKTDLFFLWKQEPRKQEEEAEPLKSCQPVQASIGYDKCAKPVNGCCNGQITDMSVNSDVDLAQC